MKPDFVRFALLKHVVNRWGAQTLAARHPTAFLYILRAKSSRELGPFTSDGPFVLQVLHELRALTNEAFAFDQVLGFTFSSGISDFNVFLNAVASHINVRAVVNIDPNPAVPAGASLSVARQQFVTGQTFRGMPPPGFEFMPLPRWSNEPLFSNRQFLDEQTDFFYLHNHCMPMYALHLGMQMLP